MVGDATRFCTLWTMPISVRDLLETPGLQLKAVAGEAGLDHPIRWAHISELPDPTPWLSGGEFLLTTGLGVDAAAAKQRAYVRRLVETGVSGLGFGIGFTFKAVPEGLVRAAERTGLAVLEVPYPIPFIAITEAVSRALSRDRLKDMQMSVEVHERLAALIAEGSGPADLLDEVVSLAGGWAMLFDLRGRLLARSRASAAEDLDPGEVWENLPEGLTDRRGPTTLSETSPRGTRVGLVVAAQKRPEAILVFGKDTRMEPRDRIVVHHALTVLSLLLASRRAVIEAERRVAGDVLGEAFSGRLTGADLERRLNLVGFSVDGPLTALVVEAPLERLDLDRTQLMYRVAQEGLRNVMAHAGASRVTVSITSAGSTILLEVVDDGRGVEGPEVPDRPGHLGIRALASLAAGLGSRLTVRPTPGRGTVLALEVAIT